MMYDFWTGLQRMSLDSEKHMPANWEMKVWVTSLSECISYLCSLSQPLLIDLSSLPFSSSASTHLCLFPILDCQSIWNISESSSYHKGPSEVPYLHQKVHCCNLSDIPLSSLISVTSKSPQEVTERCPQENIQWNFHSFEVKCWGGGVLVDLPQIHWRSFRGPLEISMWRSLKKHLKLPCF